MWRVRSGAVCFWITVLLVIAKPIARAQLGLATNLSRQASAVQVERPPRIDGTLEDPLWRTAPVIGDFRQREPLETQPATQKTEVHILYDSRHIYFGIHCY